MGILCLTGGSLGYAKTVRRLALGIVGSGLPTRQLSENRNLEHAFWVLTFHVNVSCTQEKLLKDIWSDLVRMIPASSHTCLGSRRFFNIR